MRFKKLKTTVAIALIIFILVIGSIVIIGLVQAAKNQNHTPQRLTVTNVNQANSPQVNKNTNNVQTQVQTQQQSQIIFHPMIRTMAS